MNSLTGMIALITATWVLLMAEVYLFFGIIRPLAPNIHESMFSAALKIGAVLALLVAWGVAMFVFERFFVRSALKSEPPAPSL